MSTVITRMNGAGLHIAYGNKVKEISFYPDGERISFNITLKDDREIDGLMYLKPEEAMKFAKAMEASAIEAFKNVSA